MFSFLEYQVALAAGVFLHLEMGSRELLQDMWDFPYNFNWTNTNYGYQKSKDRAAAKIGAA